MAKDDKLTRDERPTTKEEKLKALDAAISHIEKQYGKGSVMKLGDNSAHMNVEAVPTGSLSLDLALGIGGLPKGRIIEIYGPESSGKTTVALHAVAEVQKRGGIAGFIDAEHALDPVYAKNIGDFFLLGSVIKPLKLFAIDNFVCKIRFFEQYQ